MNKAKLIIAHMVHFDAILKRQLVRLNTHSGCCCFMILSCMLRHEELRIILDDMANHCIISPDHRLKHFFELCFSVFFFRNKLTVP